ncbi:hypothetical protein R5R35_010238 [Gryllus longicercus]|uniref:t-SNARE coiled-coil homology domain-containing protein n=1 Tax=Gryllus longicercus TaxID=2509291 RepID=A0AAN9VDW5_9ORTH
MTARRRRGTSESDQTPLIVASGVSHSVDAWSYQKDPNAYRTYISNNESENSRLFVDDTVSKSFEKVNVPTMTSRDRTAEFANAVRSLQGQHVTRAVAFKDARKAKYIQSYAEFMVIARTIGKNISSTYTKLEKLTLLAKRKSLFNDRPSEIQELTYIIKEDLNSLNQQIARLQDVARLQRQKQQNGHHLLSHSSSVVLALQSKLASMSTEFKQVLEVRTENLKQQKTRRDQFSQGPLSSSLPPSAISGHHQGSVLLAEEQVTVNMEPNSQMMPVVQKQVMVADETESYIQSRAETMQNIESTIVELGGIFQQLAHMVKEQEEMVERIDANLSDTELNVESAHGEILKYFQSVTSNRWLMIKVFAVLIVFFIFFVLFLA